MQQSTIFGSRSEGACLKSSTPISVLPTAHDCCATPRTRLSNTCQTCTLPSRYFAYCSIKQDNAADLLLTRLQADRQLHDREAYRVYMQKIFFRR